MLRIKYNGQTLTCKQKQRCGWLGPFIKTTVSECIARLAQISRVKHCLVRTSLLTAINALVFSTLYYCSNVWANTTKKNVRKLQAVQKFACRTVSGARKYDHVTPHLKKSLSWLPVNDQLYHRQALMHFRTRPQISDGTIHNPRASYQAYNWEWPKAQHTSFLKNSFRTKNILLQKYWTLEQFRPPFKIKPFGSSF